MLFKRTSKNPKQMKKRVKPFHRYSFREGKINKFNSNENANANANVFLLKNNASPVHNKNVRWHSLGPKLKILRLDTAADQVSFAQINRIALANPTSSERGIPCNL